MEILEEGFHRGILNALVFLGPPITCYHGDGSQNQSLDAASCDLQHHKHCGTDLISAKNPCQGFQDALTRRGELSLMTRRSTIRNQTRKELSESKDNSFTSYQQPLLSFRFEIAASVP